MREILFRGKRVHTGKWIQGHYIKMLGMSHIEIPGSERENASFTAYTVNSKTVGQYTGFKDKNGTKIFEGDICGFCNTDGELTNYEVLWFGRKWVVREANSNAVDDLDLSFCERSVVIGNIYDNPELMKGVK